MRFSKIFKKLGESKIVFKINFIVLSICLLSVFCVFVTKSHAAEVYAKSASYFDVSSAVSSANSGDTVAIPAGTATWNSQLLINKFITLKGAGVDSTLITGNTGSSFLIQFSLSSVASANLDFGLNNFTINFAHPLKVSNSSTTYKVTKFKVHDMYFTNCAVTTFEIAGFINGVIYSNIFDGYPHFDNYGYQRSSWDNSNFTPGSSDNVYYEDNTFNLTNSSVAAFFSGGWGGRYCARYNNWSSNVGLYPWFDAHGNQQNGVYGTMGIEIYGNKITTNSAVRLVDHRGGQALIYVNRVIGSSTPDLQIREEVWDGYSPTTRGIQHVHDSYYWNNRNSSEKIGAISLQSNICGTANTSTSPICSDNVHGYSLNENDEFFFHNASFNGSSGIGCGSLAEMNSISPTTENVGFWVTNQSCDSISNENVGVNPRTPITGTLYINKGGTWQRFYTPYTYPHPLRVGGESQDIRAPVGLEIITK